MIRGRERDGEKTQTHTNTQVENIECTVVTEIVTNEDGQVNLVPISFLYQSIHRTFID